MDTLGERIVYAIALRGMNKGEAAKKIGISPQYLSDITKGRRVCSDKLKATISQQLRISYDWLVDGAGVIETSSLTHEQEDIATMVARMFSNDPSDPKRAMVMSILKMNDAELEVIDRFMTSYVTQKRRKENQ